jgi:hypothetical protein
MICSNCNNNCNNSTKCGCTDSYLTTPLPCPTPVDCPDVQPCSETFDSQCIIYTGDAITCGNDVIINTNTTIANAILTITNYFCNTVNIENDLSCPESVTIIAPAGTPVNEALEAVVNYFCVNGFFTVVEAGTGIVVTDNTVGNTTTFTVSTESPILKKFIYEVTLPDASSEQQITIFNPNYASCNLPTIGCDGTSTVVPEVVDLIIQGYWFYVDGNYWVEFTHTDRTSIFIDTTGNIILTTPILTPTPSDPDIPVRVRITVIG